MIIVPDIHINNKYWSHILHMLEEFFEKWNDKEVIFLWDFVYMFSYDRDMLLKLFYLMIKLYNQGRQIYVLAWNHDRLSGHFVYSEGGSAFDIINQFSTDGRLKFITKSWLEDRGDFDLFFLPHDPYIEDIWWADIDLDKVKWSYYDILKTISNKIDIWLSSSSTNHIASAKVNQKLLSIVYDYILNHKNKKKLTVMHHYYILDTVFPWLRGKFWQYDIGLYTERCDIDFLQLISWHVHHPFQYKNYLCCGAVRATSRWEIDDIRYMWRCDDKLENWIAYNTDINMYMSLEYKNQPISIFHIEDKLSHIREDSKNYLSWEKDILYEDNPIDVSHISLILKTKNEVTDHTNVLWEDLKYKLKDFVVKHDILINEKIQLELSNKQIEMSVEYTQQMLLEFLKQKYPQDSWRYIQYLKKLEIIK